MGVLKVPASVPPVRSPAPNEPAAQSVVSGNGVAHGPTLERLQGQGGGVEPVAVTEVFGTVPDAVGRARALPFVVEALMAPARLARVECHVGSDQHIVGRRQRGGIGHKGVGRSANGNGLARGGERNRHVIGPRRRRRVHAAGEVSGAERAARPIGGGGDGVVARGPGLERG